MDVSAASRPTGRHAGRPDATGAAASRNSSMAAGQTPPTIIPGVEPAPGCTSSYRSSPGAPHCHS